MKYLCSIFIFCLFHSAFCNEKDLFQAENYVEAGDYTSAINIYARLLDSKELWKNAIVTYNLGTLFILAKEYGDSIKKFEEINFGVSPFPFFLKNYYTNLAIANWRLGNFIENKKNDQNAVHSLNHFEIALNNLVKIYDADRSIKELEETIRKKIALTKDQYRQGILKTISINESLLFIYISSKNFIDSLKNINFSEDLKLIRQQLMKIHSEAASWLPLLENMKKKDPTLDQISLLYQSFITALNQEHVEVALDKIQNVELIIHEKISNFDLKSVLSLINTEYKEIFLSKFLFSKKIQSILLLQNNLLSIHPDDTLKDAQKYLQNAYEKFSSNETEYHRIYLLLAYQTFKNFEEKFENPKNDSIIILVEKMIDQQSFNLLMTSFAYKNNDIALKKIALKNQNKTLNLAEDFWKLSNSLQEKQYRNTACSYFPWYEAIPLFLKGIKDAENAENFMTQEKSLSEIMTLQNYALNHWKKVLELLKEDPTKHKTCKEQNKENPKNNSMDESLRLLQQMDQDDREMLQKKKSIPGGNVNLW